MYFSLINSADIQVVSALIHYDIVMTDQLIIIAIINVHYVNARLLYRRLSERAFFIFALLTASCFYSKPFTYMYTIRLQSLLKTEVNVWRTDRQLRVITNKFAFLNSSSPFTSPSQERIPFLRLYKPPIPPLSTSLPLLPSCFPSVPRITRFE